MSVVYEGQAETLQSPFEDVHRDEEFKKRFFHTNY